MKLTSDIFEVWRICHVSSATELRDDIYNQRIDRPCVKFFIIILLLDKTARMHMLIVLAYQIKKSEAFAGGIRNHYPAHPIVPMRSLFADIVNCIQYFCKWTTMVLIRQRKAQVNPGIRCHICYTGYFFMLRFTSWKLSTNSKIPLSDCTETCLSGHLPCVHFHFICNDRYSINQSSRLLT